MIISDLGFSYSRLGQASSQGLSAMGASGPQVTFRRGRSLTSDYNFSFMFPVQQSFQQQI